MTTSLRKSHEEALTIRRKSLPKDAPEIGWSLYNLGLVESELGDAAPARTNFQEALEIRRRLRPEDERGIAQALDGLGTAQQQLHDYDAAHKSHEEALAICRRFPQNDSDLAMCLRKLGYAQWMLQDYPSARKSFEELLTIRRRILTKDDPAIAESLNDLGAVQWELHDYIAAKKCHEEALAIRRKIFPKDDPAIAQSLDNLERARVHIVNQNRWYSDAAVLVLIFGGCLLIRRGTKTGRLVRRPPRANGPASGLWARMRQSRFAWGMTIVTCLWIALAIVAAEAMKRKQPDDPRWKLYLGCLVMLMVPLFAIAASRRWVVSSRPPAFFLGGFLTICAYELLVVVVASIHFWASVSRSTRRPDK